jgi:hypothetical protein
LSKARRLLVPFLVWSLVFAVVQVALALKHSEPTFGWWESYMVLTGTWGASLDLAVRLSRFDPGPLVPASAGLASGPRSLVAHASCRSKGTPAAVPFGLWSFGIIPILVGIAYLRLGLAPGHGDAACSASVDPASWAVPSPDNITIIVRNRARAADHVDPRARHGGLGLVRAACRAGSSCRIRWSIIVGQSLRITWVELALFSVVVSVDPGAADPRCSRSTDRAGMGRTVQTFVTYSRIDCAIRRNCTRARPGFTLLPVHRRRQRKTLGDCSQGPEQHARGDPA